MKRSSPCLDHRECLSAFGARLRPDAAALMPVVRTFLASITVCDFDATTAKHHAEARVRFRQAGRNAGAFDLMIAAHARALGATLVTSDQATASLSIEGLRVVDW